MMRQLIGIVIAAFFLVGCGKNLERTERELAACRLEVGKVLPAEAADPGKNFNALIDACMSAKGYQSDFSATKWPCDKSRSEECYEPPKTN